MTSIALKKIDGQSAGTVELSDAVFGADRNEFVVREALNAYNANQRQGTHQTKTRGFVRGGGKKPWRQKGTGRARAGSIRSPLWRGGAIIFGPVPRDYREKVNRKKRQTAFRAVLSARAVDGNLIVVDNFDLSAPKTKDVLAALEKLGAKGRVLILTKGVNKNLLLSTRNTLHVKTQVCNSLDVYQLLMADTVVITREALDEIQAQLAVEKD